MSIPDFERAEYIELVPPAPPSLGSVLPRPPYVAPGQAPLPAHAGQVATTFPLALAFGFVAAVVGSIGYALVGLTGFMVSIVAIGIGWLIAKAMMTATGGVGGRPYQIAAALLTYFAVSCGELIHPVWTLAHSGRALALMMPLLLKFALFGPFLELNDGINGVLGLVILGVGIRAAWRMAAGGTGFGNRTTPFG